MSEPAGLVNVYYCGKHTFVAEVAVSAVAAAQSIMTALADSFGRISRTLDAAWKLAQQEHRGR